MGLEQAWYSSSRWLCLLRPLELLFRGIAARRRQRYRDGSKPSWTAPVPVIVVGNISVGGTGKSPLVIWLVEYLRQQGYKPGVISRGYRATPPTNPYFVTSDSTAAEAGDEPLMIVRRTHVPLVISPDRVAAAKLLLEQTGCDLIISDDGLQHYALNRTLEIAVIDGVRGFGNRRCLPEGPLREPVERLNEVDLIVVNGGLPDTLLDTTQAAKAFTMTLQPGHLVSLSSDTAVSTDQWSGCRQVNAVAAIGNPERFSHTLKALGFTPELHCFPDHHHFSQRDLSFEQQLPLIMTEKDAVKCDHITLKNSWYLQVDARLGEGFAVSLERLLSR
ncbi:tetraacyldisaccharide 4'-kinase [Amphritea pacifica]|uniref:Tetraacyldisaccharide 4'-kinase n=1 Tax=Amphritea pacifica TaxID=2811233 RepID=A0ABS2W614_9GAMM|nr:tetraacyldisaccharide 4'-kinase [Amphritea pacifica]MBN0987151.1 tetraacyldisaccharide 4'-kinase [Amphritea pacifica]MBN1007843.1 tetraacyldisaccharide 4'-kinase [Amphritea pacifica]